MLRSPHGGRHGDDLLQESAQFLALALVVARCATHVRLLTPGALGSNRSPRPGP